MSRLDFALLLRWNRPHILCISMFADVVELASSNVVKIDVNIEGDWGNGTGLLFDEEGSILTCEHVICPNGFHSKGN